MLRINALKITRHIPNARLILQPSTNKSHNSSENAARSIKYSQHHFWGKYNIYIACNRPVCKDACVCLQITWQKMKKSISLNFLFFVLKPEVKPVTPQFQQDTWKISRASSSLNKRHTLELNLLSCLSPILTPKSKRIHPGAFGAGDKHRG